MWRRLVVVLVACSADAYRLPHPAVGRAELGHAAASRRAAVPLLQGPARTQRAPPRPPSTLDGDGDGDGHGLWIRTLDQQHMVTVLSLWLWQHNLGQDCNAESRDLASRASRMRAMLDWNGEEGSSWLNPQVLKPRFLGAYIGDEMVACVQMRYQRDTLNGLKGFVEGRHVMVIDNVLVLPSMPSQSRLQVSAGVIDSLREMGRCHGMQVVFN